MVSPTEDFFKSYPYSELRSSFVDDNEWKSVFSTFMSGLLKIHVDRFETFTQLVENLKNSNYLEARKCLGIRDDYAYIALDVGHLRNIIKYFLSGLIKTSSFTEIATYKEYCEQYIPQLLGNNRFDSYSELFQKANKVNSVEELKAFNEYFKNMIFEMSIKMIDNYIVWFTYMVQSLQNENLYTEYCIEAKSVMADFKEHIEKVKLF
jgi:hypothetical protein